MIPREVIEEIKYRSDITRVISEYVTLKRAGSNMVGLCPFHSEKSPSFTVFTGTSSFYCFGCQAGGDVVSFVMRAENLDYVDALKSLATRCGVDVPDDEFSAKREDGVSRERLLSLNRDAARYFVSCLSGSKEAQEYVSKRGLTRALLNHFGIGYSPNDFTSLTEAMKKLGYTEAELEKAFLAKRSEKNGRLYDIFRNRIMFPIIDVNGNVVAFGGRIITDEKPKYVNTSDTPVYNKSRHLFALNFAKGNCGERMILCEGYMDVVSLHGAGFSNAVATCGTAMTQEQARLMKRYTKQVVISYDADEAGQHAASRAFDIFGEIGLDCRLLKVENAKDPDEYIKKFGASAFSTLLDGSSTKFAFKYRGVVSKYDINTTDGKVAATAELAEIIASFDSMVERDLYAHEAAEKLGINVDAFKNEIKKIEKKRGYAEKREERNELIRQSVGYGDKINPDKLKNLGAAVAEEAILGVMILHPELINEGVAKLGITAEDFVTPFNKRVFESLYKNKDGFDTVLLNEEFNRDEISKITLYSVERQNLTDNNLEIIKSCLDKLRDEKAKSGMSLEELLERKRRKK